MIMIGNRQVMPIKFNSYLGEIREIFNFNCKSKRYLYLLKINQIARYLSTKTINKLNKRYQLRVSFKFIWLFIQLAEPWFVSQCNFIPCTGDWIGVVSVWKQERLNKVLVIVNVAMIWQRQVICANRLTGNDAQGVEIESPHDDAGSKKCKRERPKKLNQRLKI